MIPSISIHVEHGTSQLPLKTSTESSLSQKCDMFRILVVATQGMLATPFNNLIVFTQLKLCPQKDLHSSSN
jgi:hypothetical protein